MWIDKAREARQKLGISYRETANRTNGKLSERDVMKMLKGEYKRPPVDDVIVLGAALNLTPTQLFEDSSLVIESAETAKEATDLRDENKRLTSEVESLKKEIEYKDKLLAAKEEALEAYKIIVRSKH
jgi:transcriptional regulator with XRE-family HTH domain